MIAVVTALSIGYVFLLVLLRDAHRRIAWMEDELRDIHTTLARARIADGWRRERATRAQEN